VLIIQTILATLSIGLFFASLWQFEIVQLRKERKEPYSLPFFITTDKEYSFWGDIWVAMMVISFILMFIAMVLGEIH
jgi:hypothetical protein